MKWPTSQYGRTRVSLTACAAHRFAPLMRSRRSPQRSAGPWSLVITSPAPQVTGCPAVPWDVSSSHSALVVAFAVDAELQIAVFVDPVFGR